MREMGAPISNNMRKALLVLNCVLLAIGNCVGVLAMRLYFVHGGKSIWISSWVESGGWPVILIPLAVAYLHRRSTEGSNAKFFQMKPPVFIAITVIGLLTGLDDYLYAYGVAHVPPATSNVILALQLAFTAGSAFLLLKQKFSSYSTNALVLLTVGPALLALHVSSALPEGQSFGEYLVALFTGLAGSALYGFLLVLVEVTYNKAKQPITYTLVMEIAMVMCFFATLFCTVVMLFNNGFEAIPREAKEYDLGEATYYMVLVGNGILWQCFFVGSIGVVFCASSLLAGFVMATLLPLIEILGVIFYSDKFRAEPGVALFFCLWGFVSYFYGEIKHSNKSTQPSEIEVLLPRFGESVRMSKIPDA